MPKASLIVLSAGNGLLECFVQRARVNKHLKARASPTSLLTLLFSEWWDTNTVASWLSIAQVRSSVALLVVTASLHCATPNQRAIERAIHIKR